MAGCVETVA
jgi:hypothetical protein